MSTENKANNAEKSIEAIVFETKRDLLGKIIAYNDEAKKVVRNYLKDFPLSDQEFYWRLILEMMTWDIKTFIEYSGSYDYIFEQGADERFAVVKRLRDMLGIDKPSFIPYCI